METKKYYLINLNTRRSSVATHLRRDNYTLNPNGCIYLGELTSELVLKYMKYSFLNIQLRILTQDIAEKILDKCVNCTEEIKEKVLKRNTEPKKEEVKTEVEKEEVEYVKELEEHENKDVVIEGAVKKSEVAAEVVTHDRDKQLSQELVNETLVQEQEHTVNEGDGSFRTVDEVIETTNVINTEQPQEIDIVAENKKQDLASMDYDDLLDLAKASGFKSKGRPSRDKLVNYLSQEKE